MSGVEMEKYKPILPGMTFLAISIFIYALSYQIHMTSVESLGPQFFPRIVAVSMAVLSIASVLRNFSKVKTAPAKPAAGKDKSENSYAREFYLTVALLILYALLIQIVGFVVLSVFYLFFQILLVSPKEDINRKKMILFGVISVVTPIGLYYLFYHAFDIFLPVGILG